ncbi:hypothetical protein [Negadavirga shengliensis]|uniref:Uncharacterized protein n=1 Tax=Negadavirga shengliensis TaxID=1389218 RepID=A0ABV9SW16_9BACT
MKLKTILAIIILALGTQSCSSTDQDNPELNELLLACQTTDPINELQWLADLDAKYDEQSNMYRIRIVEFEKTGYIMIEDPASSSPMQTIFDCRGDVAFDTDLLDVSYNDFMKNIRTIKVLKTKNWP